MIALTLADISGLVDGELAGAIAPDTATGTAVTGAVTLDSRAGDRGVRGGVRGDGAGQLAVDQRADLGQGQRDHGDSSLALVVPVLVDALSLRDLASSVTWASPVR